MGMHDIRTPIEFTCQFSYRKEMLESSNIDFIQCKRDRALQDFGMLVGKYKKPWWKEDFNSSINVYTQTFRMFVFSPNELTDYVEAKIKQKLQEMASRDTEKDIAERLMMLSERA